MEINKIPHVGIGLGNKNCFRCLKLKTEKTRKSNKVRNLSAQGQIKESTKYSEIHKFVIVFVLVNS